MTTEWLEGLEVCLLAAVLAAVGAVLWAYGSAVGWACREWPRMAAMLGRRPDGRPPARRRGRVRRD